MTACSAVFAPATAGSISDKANPHPFNQFISFTVVGAGLQPIVWRAAPEAAQASARAAQRRCGSCMAAAGRRMVLPFF
jgi:C4-dicarboxylate transporter